MSLFFLAVDLPINFCHILFKDANGNDGCFSVDAVMDRFDMDSSQMHAFHVTSTQLF